MTSLSTISTFFLINIFELQMKQKLFKHSFWYEIDDRHGKQQTDIE